MKFNFSDLKELWEEKKAQAEVQSCYVAAYFADRERQKKIMAGLFALTICASLVSPESAMAADSTSVGSSIGNAADGSGLPWEGPMASLQRSLTGPIAKAAAMIIVVCAGIFVALGEGGPAGRLVGRLVFGLGLLFGALQIINRFMED